MSPDEELRPPGPRAHLAGALALVDAVVAEVGDRPEVAAVRRFLDRPEALPPVTPPEAAGLKYDVYLAAGRGGAGWGVAVSDRWEEGRMDDAVAALLAALPGAWDLPSALRLRAALGGGPSLVLAVGFDAADRPPRLKLYLQEERQGAGVTDAGTFRAVTRGLGPPLPAWIDDARRLGVVTVELHADGRLGLKAYLGGPDPLAPAAGAPADARALADALAAACPLLPAWWYLTVRLADPPRYAMNKIYNPVRLAFTRGGTGLGPAWADVAALFARAGRAEALARLRAAVDRPGLRVAPTATALEDGGRSADVYCAAWAVEP